MKITVIVITALLLSGCAQLVAETYCVATGCGPLSNRKAIDLTDHTKFVDDKGNYVDANGKIVGRVFPHEKAKP